MRGLIDQFEVVCLALSRYHELANLANLCDDCWDVRVMLMALEQKRRAVEAYTRYIAAIYASRFDAYAGEQFQVLGQQPIKHGTLIKTHIVKSNGEPVSINYVVHDNDIAWQIRDIYLSGSISELATRRSDFAATVRSSGIEGLIATLNKKADDLQI